MVFTVVELNMAAVEPSDSREPEKRSAPDDRCADASLPGINAAAGGRNSDIDHDTADFERQNTYAEQLLEIYFTRSLGFEPKALRRLDRPRFEGKQVYEAVQTQVGELLISAQLNAGRLRRACNAFVQWGESVRETDEFKMLSSSTKDLDQLVSDIEPLASETPCEGITFGDIYYALLHDLDLYYNELVEAAAGATSDFVAPVLQLIEVYQRLGRGKGSLFQRFIQDLTETSEDLVRGQKAAELIAGDQAVDRPDPLKHKADEPRSLKDSLSHAVKVSSTFKPPTDPSTTQSRARKRKRRTASTIRTYYGDDILSNGALECALDVQAENIAVYERFTDKRLNQLLDTLLPLDGKQISRLDLLTFIADSGESLLESGVAIRGLCEFLRKVDQELHFETLEILVERPALVSLSKLGHAGSLAQLILGQSEPRVTHKGQTCSVVEVLTELVASNFKPNAEELLKNWQALVADENQVSLIKMLSEYRSAHLILADYLATRQSSPFKSRVLLRIGELQPDDLALKSLRTTLQKVAEEDLADLSCSDISSCAVLIAELQEISRRDTSSPAKTVATPSVHYDESNAFKEHIKSMAWPEELANGIVIMFDSVQDQFKEAMRYFQRKSPDHLKQVYQDIQLFGNYGSFRAVLEDRGLRRRYYQAVMRGDYGYRDVLRDLAEKKNAFAVAQTAFALPNERKAADLADPAAEERSFSALPSLPKRVLVVGGWFGESDDEHFNSLVPGVSVETFGKGGHRFTAGKVSPSDLVLVVTSQLDHQKRYLPAKRACRKKGAFFRHMTERGRERVSERIVSLCSVKN